eukprot:528991-Hanusia_phi.AAC.1
MVDVCIETWTYGSFQTLSQGKYPGANSPVRDIYILRPFLPYPLPTGSMTHIGTESGLCFYENPPAFISIPVTRGGTSEKKNTEAATPYNDASAAVPIQLGKAAGLHE